MATRVVELTEEQACFIEAQVRSGRFADAQAVVEEGLRLLEDDEEGFSAEEKAARTAWLHEAIAEGEADLARGNYITLRTDEEITALVDKTFETVMVELRAVEAKRA